MPRISFDGETWYEVSADRLRSLAALPEVDCRVDLAGDGGPPFLTTLSECRRLVASGLSPAAWRPPELLGRPVVFTEDPTVGATRDRHGNPPPSVFVELE